MGGAGSGSNKSSGKGSSKPIDAGGGILSGVLLDAFSQQFSIENGQIVQGSGIFKPHSNRWYARKAEEEYRAKHGKGDTTYHEYKHGWGEEIKELKERHKKRWEAKQAAGSLASGPGGALVRNLLGGIEDEAPFGNQMIDAGNQVAAAQRNIFDLSTQSLSGLISDGRPVDVQALVNRGLTDLKEQFGGQGLSYGSDVQNAAVRAGAEMRTVSEENARNRQMGALQLGQTHGQQGLQFGSMLGNLGAQHELQNTPWGRAVTRFGQLANPQPTAISSIGSIQKNEEKSSGSNWNVSGL